MSHLVPLSEFNHIEVSANDGGTLEYVFETDQEDLPQTVAKSKAAEIAANFMTTFITFRSMIFERGSYELKNSMRDIH
jgi:hypothetical protein